MKPLFTPLNECPDGTKTWSIFCIYLGITYISFSLFSVSLLLSVAMVSIKEMVINFAVYVFFSCFQFFLRFSLICFRKKTQHADGLPILNSLIKVVCIYMVSYCLKVQILMIIPCTAYQVVALKIILIYSQK